jgi:Glycosyltransferases involved in cell wall biogenesis
MKSPLVSVIIPTRNRQEYAEKTIRQIAELNQNIEIVVQDNSDDDYLKELLNDLLSNENIKYSYCETTLPFSENYNRAMERVTGDYVCAIGDDDGILPNISECAIWMKENEIDVIKPAKDQVYFYPGNINKKKNACIGFGQYKGSYYYSNPETAVISLLDDGGCNYLEKDLAGSYHGLVKRDSMNKVKQITGKFYSGLTPDMYSVICLSLLPNIRLAVVDYPITLPGVCPTSGSAASDSGKHVGNIKDAPHLKQLPDYMWNSSVPRYYSVETIWAETMLYAIKKMGRDDLIDKYFNSNRLAQYLYQNNKPQREEILKIFTKETSEYVLKCCGENSIEGTNKTIQLLENIAIKLSGKRKIVRNISDINKAVDVLYSELATNMKNVPWRLHLKGRIQQ